MSRAWNPPPHDDDVKIEAPRGGFTSGFVVFCMILTGLITYAVVSHQNQRKLTALTETMEATFKKMGEAYRAQGHVATADEIAERMKSNMGAAFASELKRQGGTPASHLSAQGTIPAFSPPPTQIQLEPSPTGWSGSASQDRAGLPPLTRVDFEFLPIGGAKIAWHNNAEKFNLSFAAWRTKGDGMSAAAKLTRTVEGKTEVIELDQADAYFSQVELLRVAPAPKFSLAVGIGTVQGHMKPIVLIEKPITRRWSLVTGYANGGSVLIGKYTWSK